MIYVGPAPVVSYYGMDQMQETDRREFLTSNDTVVKKEVFDKRRVLESNCQAEMMVLREACRTFRRHFLQIGNVDVLLETMTIASACNKTFRKNFLQPDKIGIIPVGGYTDNRKQSRKATGCLKLEEKKGGKWIMHGGEDQGAPAAGTTWYTCGWALRGDAHSIRVPWLLLAQAHVHAVS
jgi:hypothetical protein